ncbi:putative glutamic acid/alanine-rich protein [Trypanosoma rangeli]|uniref:Putative glutamic acid/alanine-rich protein n=1 Tax=Trypanosoma rangeli TaxID=5698 RepID=A0A3R7NHX3_TRYRA|nr:putative glutamic acid/alanine-rich protein [Trypanosoma rangeli]RNF02898.1 putative glutamic acid/alanine-rich protein [Trypanosoma rangeli]|eukprot:RNF02898.1 putative glutamic acid/alanine-rich protein [Trypanosoma rangeli]
MPRKGKKKNAPLQLVAPEPTGDELEADMLWDRVKEVKDKPAFMDGSLLDATRACFEGEKGWSGTGEAARTAFLGRPRHLVVPRAQRQFLEAEVALKQQMENIKNIQEEARDFELLKGNEREEARRSREKVNKAALNLMTELSDARLTLLEDMEELAADFFAEQCATLQTLTELAVKDNEVEAAFLEQVTTQQRCLEAEQLYFTGHGEHLALMAEMQNETRRQKEEMLRSIVRRLEMGVSEMTKLSLEEMGDKVHQREEMSQLIVDLLKAQWEASVLEKKTTTIAEQRTALLRTIALELQKQQLCIKRQKQLREELSSLTATVRENNIRLLTTTSNAVPGISYAAAPPTMPKSPNTMTGLTELGEGKGLALMTVEAQRELEVSVTELANYKKELWFLQQQHLVQLSGQYQPVDLDTASRIITQDFFLDADTKAAVRSVVVEAMLQVGQILGVSDYTTNLHEDVGRLLFVTDLRDLRAIQDYVARRINALFSCTCPTAPPLPFPPEAAYEQSEM